MNKEWFTRGTLVLIVSAVGTVVMTGHALGEPNKVEKAAAAKVSIDEALTTAREKVSGTVIEAALAQKHDRPTWQVEVVTSEQQIMEVHIDAQTGTVIDVEEEQVKSKRIHRRN